MPNPLDRDTNDNAQPDDDADELEGDEDDEDEDDDDDDDGAAAAGDREDDGAELEGDDDEGTEAIEDEAIDDGAREPNAGGLRAFLSTLQLGEPFAISGDVEIVEAKIIVRHEAGPHAGKKFRVDLLNAKTKHSPYDGSAFSHALIIAPADDAEIVLDVVSHILEANGHDAP